MKQRNRVCRTLGLLLALSVLLCALPGGLIARAEEGHVHTAACYAQAGDLLCTLAEEPGHGHGDACRCPGGEPVCALEESESHAHTESCYVGAAEGEALPVCGLEESEGHVHTDACRCPGGEPVCGLEESEGHAHTEECRAKGGELICGLEESEAPAPAANAGGPVTTPEALRDAVWNAQDGDTITLGGNIFYDTLDDAFGPLTVEKKLTIDFNGYTLFTKGGTYQSGKDCLFNVAEGGGLTLVGAQTKMGDFQNASNQIWAGDFIGENHGTVTVESTAGIGVNAYNFIYDNYGTITVREGTFQLGCFDGYNRGKIEVFSGQFHTSSACFDCVYGEVVIHDATVVSEGNAIYTSDSDGAYGTATIYAGSYTSNGSDCIYNSAGCTVTIYSGTFREIDDTDGCFYGDGEWIIPKNYAADPADWQETKASSIRVYPLRYTVRFYAEGRLIDEQQGFLDEMSFPAAPVHSQGYEFLYWEDENGVPVTELGALSGDAVLNAVFSDRTFTITFEDRGETGTKTVAADTPLGRVEGLGRKANGGHFRYWTLNGAPVNEKTELPVRSDLTLVAKYDRVVTTYEELLAALEERAEVILIAAEIPVEETVVVDYSCTILSDEKIGLIRPEGFSDALLETQTNPDAPDVPVTVTLDNLLLDGRNVEALSPAVVVGETTTLIVQNTTIRNNKNEDTGYYALNGGAIYNKGMLKMYDGTLLTGNTAEKGGGVYCARVESDEQSPVFYLYGGEISGNTALDASTSCNAAGGGVSIDGTSRGHGYFYMYGGKITRNSAPNGCGGGVSLCCGDQSIVDTRWRKEDIVFTMYGGEITDNTTGEHGGGVWVGCSTFEMQDGLISRNAAAESGGGLAACCGCELNVRITGGAITLNNAAEGGGVGKELGGYIQPGVIYDNLASEAGDDLVFDGGDWLRIVNRMPARRYGASYASNEALNEEMRALIAAAKPTVDVETLEGYAIADGLEVPFLGWYADGTLVWGGETPRYATPSGEKYDRESNPLEWYSHWEHPEGGDDDGQAAKAIWYGVLLVYEANYGESTAYLCDQTAYAPGSAAVAAGQILSRPGYRIVSWNTERDGTGEAYAIGDRIEMLHSRVLYAQWEKLPEGRLTIAKKVSGTGLPEAQTAFVFTVTKDGAPAAGQYSIDGGAAEALPADGTLLLKAGQSALLTNLTAGDYVVTESAPAQAAYRSTTYCVNDGGEQSGLAAAVTVTAAAESGAEGSSAAASVTFINNYQGGEVAPNPVPVPGPSQTPGETELPKPSPTPGTSELPEPSEEPEGGSDESADEELPAREEEGREEERIEPDDVPAAGDPEIDVPTTGDPANEALRNMLAALSLLSAVLAAYAVNRRTKRAAK